ncbi:coiled-coil domain-containing protein 22 like protein [Ditylenchus destructor]|uniref:Coiled-coil domain-containing protein 22 homolog n=1 Tax=Ditylenchus destructor TaxID=166010 RepID=A0AAD4R2J8_9BILA|nr:coiled-coil domain-containing protein 22 like protein [Ditylenchus destructor]
MEDVDRMILESLTRLQCSFCTDGPPASLALLSTDDVVEGVVRLLWACDTNTHKTIPSYKLPSHTTGRFKMATQLAKAIKDIGIREEFGYQTFLYHSIFDIRRIFLALVDKFPEESMQVELTLSPFEKLKQNVGAHIAKHFNEPWVPEFCRCLRLKYDGRFWCPNQDQPEDFEFITDPKRSRRYDNRLPICSALERLDWLSIPYKTDAKVDVRNIKWDVDAHFEHFDSSSVMFDICDRSKPAVPTKPKSLPKTAPKAAPKPTDLSPTSPVAKELPNLPIEEHDSRPAQVSPTPTVSNEIANLLEEISVKEAQLDARKREMIELGFAQAHLEAEIERMTKSSESNDQRLIQLLQEPEASIAKLEKFMAESDQKRVELQERFFEAKAEKEQDLERARIERGLSKENAELQQQSESQLQNLKEQISNCEGGIAEKTRIKNKLEKEIRKLPADHKKSNERSKYVRRVLEIVANVNKQNEEILKTVKSVRKVEHEIKSLTGNLDRTFIVVDKWLGESTGMDIKLQQAYKILVRMHEQCGLVQSAISENGQVSRQLDELADQIEIEEQKTVDSQLERLLSDLIHLRQENNEMAKRLSIA